MLNNNAWVKSSLIIYRSKDVGSNDYINDVTKAVKQRGILMTKKIKLTYFNVRAKAEIIRLILIAGNIDFEDVQITMEQWPTIKPTTPAGLLPIVELDDGTVLNESMAIARHFARTTKLAGSTEMDVYRSDRAACTIDDLFEKLFVIVHEQDKEKHPKLEDDLLNIYLPTCLDNLTKYLKETTGDFFLGAQPSYADLHLVNILDHFDEGDFKSHPEVAKCFTSTLEHFPEVKKYRAARPKTAY